MANTIKIKRGVDIKLKGEAEQIYATAEMPETFALKPTDFKGVRLKLAAREGDEVKAGQPLLYNKDRKEVKICSPVSGEVVEIVRGAKRKMLEVKVLADKEIRYEDFGKADPEKATVDEIKDKLLRSGCWPLLRQRPYNILANPEITPKAIFISGFDTAPLAPDVDFTIHGREDEFKTGIKVLQRLTEGKVHIGLDGTVNPPAVYRECEGVELNFFKGPHPAGNVGTHIHHVDPINKGDYVWTIHPQDVIVFGLLFTTGKFDAQRHIALAGSEIEKPRYYKTLIGSNVNRMLEDNLKEGGEKRIISGNVLTGTRIKGDGYLGFYDYQVTAIPEGGEPQFMGWLAPNFHKFSISRTLFSWLLKNKRYNLDTSMNGEERAYVVTGEYEKVFPFNIYPVHLIKSIMIQDIEAMENLGLYEVVEEDVALCEVVCTSKIPVQETLREGIDMMIKELGE